MPATALMTTPNRIQVPNGTAMMRDLGQQIRAARASRGWSQSVLAKMAGVSRPSIARIEAGEDVNTQTLSKVVDALGCSLAIGI